MLCRRTPCHWTIWLGVCRSLVQPNAAPSLPALWLQGQMAVLCSSGGPDGASVQPTGENDLHVEADTNLQNHFDSIQIISERTTLPQMLLELAKGLSRTADVSSLILRLKCVL